MNFMNLTLKIEYAFNSRASRIQNYSSVAKSKYSSNTNAYQGLKDMNSEIKYNNRLNIKGDLGRGRSRFRILFITKLFLVIYKNVAYHCLTTGVDVRRGVCLHDARLFSCLQPLFFMIAPLEHCKHFIQFSQLVCN